MVAGEQIIIYVQFGVFKTHCVLPIVLRLLQDPRGGQTRPTADYRFLAAASRPAGRTEAAGGHSARIPGNLGRPGVGRPGMGGVFEETFGTLMRRFRQRRLSRARRRWRIAPPKTASACQKFLEFVNVPSVRAGVSPKRPPGTARQGPGAPPPDPP